MAHDVVGRRLLLLEQHLHQVVVEVGELLEHLEARVRLTVGELGGDVDQLALLAVAVDVGALEREIDEALGVVAVPDRDLAHHQRPRADLLQRAQKVARAHARLVDLVDEDHVRRADLVERLQGGLGGDDAGGVGLDDGDDDIDRGKHVDGLGGELDGAGKIEKRVAVAEILEAGDVELGGEAALAGFRAGVAVSVAGVDPALLRSGAAGEQDRLHEAGLAAARASRERDRSRGRGFVLRHCAVLHSVGWRAASRPG